MMLTSERVETIPNSVRTLYMSSFPAEERIPYENLMRTFDRGGELRIFKDDGAFVGFCYSFEHDGSVFLVYIATNPDLRGKGYGAEMMDILCSIKSGKNIFLVLEGIYGTPEEAELRSRRRNFYLRNGCYETGCTLLSDDVMLDSLGVRGVNTFESMNATVRYYEDVHNGRI